MERIITSIDQHGRMLIPSSVREKFNIHPGEKITIEVDDEEIKIINADHIIDEIHELFMKNHPDRKISLVDDFIARKRQEYLIEEARSSKNV
ncbi:MAG: AbrB/MazE/SpoVT family DNA-binding domain-containing protein [Rickettsia endosymbiont of Oxypoda opaca]|nr:AbrB/MazE/SpoVT family DNA-binding domain-containing protein [Rickettsia endosymbiont of Oxypoda opaca]